jgi:putative transposase
MYQNNTFIEILKLLDRGIIKQAIDNNQSDKHSKGFGTWNHLICMLFYQFSGCRSLRDLEIRFNSKQQCHYHLRSKLIKRSTLSDANQYRNSDVFRDIAKQLIIGQTKELKEVVSLIDSSNIRVDGRGSQWTEATQTRYSKGLKLHIQCSGDSKYIENMSITKSNINDISEAKTFNLEEGKIYVFDKGYFDFNWWHKIDLTKSYFVTRIKKNTAYETVDNLDIEGLPENIVSDKIIRLTNRNPGGTRKNLLAGKLLRLVEVYDKEHNKTYQFISNLLQARADEIAAYYKQRWGVELLFKWLKQNLKVKKFVSENENAIKTQLYIAIIAYILLSMFKKLFGQTFSRTIDLISWIKISIFSSNAILSKRPTKKQDIYPSLQLSLGEII